MNSGSDIPADDQSPDASPSPPPFLRAPRFAPNGIIPRALASAFPSAVPSTDASPPPAPNPAMSSSMRRPAASSFDATALDRSDRSTAVAADACGNLVRSTLAESAATRYAHSGNSRVSLVGRATAATAYGTFPLEPKNKNKTAAREALKTLRVYSDCVRRVVMPAGRDLPSNRRPRVLVAMAARLAPLADVFLRRASVRSRECHSCAANRVRSSAKNAASGSATAAGGVAPETAACHAESNSVQSVRLHSSCARLKNRPEPLSAMARAPSIHDDAVYNARATRPASGGGHRAPPSRRTRIERCNAIDSFRPTAAATSANASVSVDILEVHDAIASGHAADPSPPPTRDPRTPHRRSPPARASSRGLTRRCRSRDVRGRRGGFVRRR